MKTITKEDIIATLREISPDAPFRYWEGIVNEVIRQINVAMLRGQRVYIRQWGVFKIVKHKERIGAHPKTHMKIVIPGKKVVRFIACKALKERLNA